MCFEVAGWQLIPLKRLNPNRIHSNSKTASIPNRELNLWKYGVNWETIQIEGPPAILRRNKPKHNVDFKSRDKKSPGPVQQAV